MRAPASARGAGVRGVALPRWGDCAPPADAPPPAHACVYDEQINQRFAIWHGDITTLEVDAITNTTDETLTEFNPVSERIMSVAGPEMKEELVTRGLECRPGSVVVTPGFGLRCRRVLHAVCPDYSPQHHAASEDALHDCYQNVLYAATELNTRTLALCVIDTPKRNFPPELASHVALRAIRRHLEQQSRVALVVLASACAARAALLAALAPVYFPRRAPEHRIRIIRNPRHDPNAEETASLCDSDAAAEAAAAFARACAPDTQRLLAPRPAARHRVDDHGQFVENVLERVVNTASPCHTQRLLAPRPVARHRIDDHGQYERLLRRARTEDLSEVSGIGCLYQSGVDRLGRPVVVFIGKWFPIGDIDLDKALLYLIKLLDPIVRGDYVIAYFHTLAASGNHPPFSWLKEVYTVLPYKYKKNLKAFYIVHPTFWTKMMTWWFTTFMAPAIKAKVHNLPGVEYLYSVMARDQLEVPAFVTEYDMTINGLHYFQPDTNST